MKNRTLFFKLQDDSTIMVYTDLTDNEILVKGWENFLSPSEKLTGWLPETAYKTILDVLIRHGAVLESIG